MYDNCSKDNTRDIINKDPRCEIIMYRSDFDDSVNQYIKNNCWKQHRGMCDYAIVCDADEFLWFPKNFKELLQNSKKKSNIFDLFPIKGFQMASKKSLNKDVKLDSQVTQGYYEKFYSKNNIFNPNTIIDMNFSPGSHQCRPQKYHSKINIGPTLYLLHYKFIGGLDRLIQRQKDYGKRLSKINKHNKWGLHYLKNNEEIEKQNNEVLKKCEQII